MKRGQIVSTPPKPHQGMSQEDLKNRHKELCGLLEMEERKRPPDELRISRLKKLKLMYKDLMNSS